MSESTPSVTALISAFTRAHHARNDTPRIFDDFLAEQLFAPEEWATISQHLGSAAAYFAPEDWVPGMAPAVALARSMRALGASISLSRARYTESLLVASVPEGIAQYVILGAGLDTFAYRCPESARQVRVFSLDHPVTQADMRRRVARAGWREPPRLRFVPIDFSRDALEDVLREAGFDSRVPAFFSWLGVTYYLPRDSVLRTLRSIATVAARGSTVVFDHLETEAFVPERASTRAQRLLAAVRQAGEPMRTGLDAAELPALLREVGLTAREQLTPADIQERYFAGRSDGYRAFDHVHFAAAVVA
ncbi:class I SAM-dependent methyltransferase [Myxococcaceae bacterium JPH2]|nr:class I SAM-dependent methyltransferase [Myxococcaceae bacterium JPH2]